MCKRYIHCIVHMCKRYIHCIVHMCKGIVNLGEVVITIDKLLQLQTQMFIRNKLTNINNLLTNLLIRNDMLFTWYRRCHTCLACLITTRLLDF